MRYLLVHILFFIALPLLASSQVLDLQSSGYHNIGRNLSYLEDKPAKMTFQEIKAMDNAGKFRRSKNEILNLGTSTSAFWIKFSYKNIPERNSFLVIDVPNIEDIDLYTPLPGGKTEHLHGGSLYPSSEDVISGKNFVFSLPDPDTGSVVQTVYMRVKSNNMMLLALKIGTAETLLKGFNSKTRFELFYIGVLLTLMLFNLFLYFGLKDRMYLYYALYVAGIFGYMILYTRGYSYVFGNSTKIFFNLYPHLFASLACISVIYFSKEFLSAKSRLKGCLWLFNTLTVCWLVILVISIFGGKLLISRSVNLLFLATGLLLWFVGLKAFLNGHRPAVYFLLAWSFICVSLVYLFLARLELVSYHDWSFEVGPMGFTFELLFLAFGLADHYNTLRRDKIAAQKENMELIISEQARLEVVVKQRTERYLEAVRTLEASNAVKDKLFSIIAHDLRSPFNSLKSIFFLTDMDLLELNELKMLLNSSRENIDQIYHTLDNLLYWAKSQMESVSSDPVSFDLKEMAEGLMLVYGPLAKSKRLALVLQTDSTCPVFADENQIQLVLRNLMDNAIKFTPIGQQITLVLSNGEDGVYVTVDNVTAGVSELQLESLLKENNHLSTRGTAKESGVGLGLLLAREYISANKGVLKVRVEGHHVIFYFNLPALVEK